MVNVGFIGAGGIARRHVGVLQQMEDVRLAAFSDPAADRAGALAGEVGAASYDDYRRMLDHEALDAVYLCVPPFAHGETELALVERGLPFFVEKPLAIDLETAERVSAAVDTAGLVTGVGYHWRYLDTTDEVRGLLADNPARLALGFWLDSTPPPDWWRHQDQSGGQMLEQTTHLFDLARYLVGDVESVYAVGGTKPRDAFADLDIFDATTASLKFASGAVGSMSSTCLLNWRHRIELHLFCESLAIEVSDTDLMIDTGRGRPVRRAEGDPVWREDRDFIDAVSGGENRIRSPYRDSLATHRLTTAANRSAASGQAMALLETEAAR